MSRLERDPMITVPTVPLGADSDRDEPAPAVSVQLPAPDRTGPYRAVWDRCGEVLGTGVAVLYGRTGASPAELRAAGAAAFAMAALLESDGWTDPECYCCTCGPEGNDWDAACRNHGAHGVRPCERHDLPGRGCDCGCGAVGVPAPAVLT